MTELKDGFYWVRARFNDGTEDPDWRVGRYSSCSCWFFLDGNEDAWSVDEIVEIGSRVERDNSSDLANLQWRSIKDEMPPGAIHVLVWEKDYGWLLAAYSRRDKHWTMKSSGNYWCDMPQSVVDNITHWAPVIHPPSKET